MIPSKRTFAWQDTSVLAEAVLDYWSNRSLPSWQTKGKVKAPRILAAKLAAGVELNEVNAYILKQTPWAQTGSSWLLHPNGDYDFTLTILTGILWLYGDQPRILYPQTREHLLNRLLTEEGTCRRLHVPETGGLVKETENHVLMTQGSCYLKNRWLAKHGNTSSKYNNAENGMEDLVLDYLGEIEKSGLYEFNSIPYLAYTMTALLNLEAFGSDAVSNSSRRILDRLNWQYAIGSLSGRRCVPFRRRIEKAGNSLTADYQHTFIKIWMSLKPAVDTAVDSDVIESSHALWPCLMPYRLSDQAAQWIERKPSQYYIRIGHGSQSSPEIYSGGPGYLLTAGGVNRGEFSMIAARPISLLLDDGAERLDQVLHLSGPGHKLTEWNNTGVYKNFACAAGPVCVPSIWKPVIENKQWQIYDRNNLLIAVYSRPAIGIIVLFDSGIAEEILSGICQSNPDESLLSAKFCWPDGNHIIYDLNASKDNWVIKSYGAERFDRKYDQWQLMQGWIRKNDQCCSNIVQAWLFN